MSIFSTSEQIAQHEAHLGHMNDLSFQQVMKAICAQKWTMERNDGGYVFWRSNLDGFIRVNSRTFNICYTSPNGKCRFNCMTTDLVKILARAIARCRA